MLESLRSELFCYNIVVLYSAHWYRDPRGWFHAIINLIHDALYPSTRMVLAGPVLGVGRLDGEGRAQNTLVSMAAPIMTPVVVWQRP
jgi:hypothetical protein